MEMEAPAASTFMVFGEIANRIQRPYNPARGYGPTGSRRGFAAAQYWIVTGMVQFGREPRQERLR